MKALTTIKESGLSFGPFDPVDCFHVEKSETYKKIQAGVKIAEFLLMREKNDKQVVWVVEAKLSAPKPETQPDFDSFINEIKEKLSNAFSVGVACCLNRHIDSEKDLPGSFKSADLSTLDFRLILVVNGHKDSWLGPVQEALQIALRHFVKTWALSPIAVQVLNESLARKYKLII